MVSEEFKRFRENRPAFRPPEPGADPRRSRKMMEKMFAGTSQAPRDVNYKRARLNGVSAEWVILDAPKDRAVMYIHGGGFILGSIASHRHFVAAIAKASGINTISVSYRLAPENPYPAALEDCLAVFRGLIKRGIPARGIVIAGESAGGNLSLATVLYLKDKNEPLPAAVVAISAATDFKATGESYKIRMETDPMADSIFEIARVYAPGEDLENPYISPLYGDYRNFPPLFIQVGTDEVLLDDSRMLAERAKTAGVAVTLRVWEDMGHAFVMDCGQYPEANAGVREIGDFIKACFKSQNNK